MLLFGDLWIAVLNEQLKNQLYFRKSNTLLALGYNFFDMKAQKTNFE